MVNLIDMNYQTRFCKFAIDASTDLNSLPTMNSSGKDVLSTIKSCAHGSLAYSTNGKKYILSGDNKWITYSGSLSGEVSGGTAISEDIEPISKSDIEALFRK